MKRKTLLLTCAFVLLVAGAGAAQMVDLAPTPPGTMTVDTTNAEVAVSGRVVSSTSTELAIDTDAGRRMTFALDPGTAPATAFTVGERVTVQYDGTSGGTAYRAASITVEPPVKVETPIAGVTTPASPRLPDTASRLPLIGLLGLLALGGAVAVRVRT